ncbi:F-box domain, cyclin-like protein [Cynara cardunculus var. scolymus]|uniref:F-box domain, cyclin-like protein n=2 Tax=Cynara cardunculus var. scolymus TaxID=59895 RepID=A0A103XGJ2_CYNCS|nr:F-box domain, cyclin-like protein [Cynara cardunculus var. scolymus]
MYTNPMDLGIFSSLGHHVEVYSLPCKRSRISAPFVFSGEVCKKQKTTIEVLPDECLFEIFRRLGGNKERSSCASVSKHWLMLLSTIHRDEISKDSEKESIPSDGHLSRCLEGKKVTDVRLAAIAVGSAGHGGLGKLSIHGNNVVRGVTNFGLTAVARGCPSLTDLSLWNLSSISDEGLVEIASGCHRLEKLDLCQIPAISNKSLMAIANNCPNLTELSIESCSNIGNEGLEAISRSCHNLKSISIKNCFLVGDRGIASLLSSASYSLKKVNLQALSLSDLSLAVIGHYGIALTALVLAGLPKVTEKGFWVMGNGQGLQKLRSLIITSCSGVTDLGLEAVGKGCPNLKQFCLRKCSLLSDNGVTSFAKSALSIENVLLEECNRVTECGVFSLLVNCSSNMKSLTLENCFGIKDLAPQIPFSRCNAFRSLSVRNCPGFGNNSLVLLGNLCPQLQHVEFTGLHGITNEGFTPLIRCCEAGLVKVNLSGSMNLTDNMVSEITKVHGETLEILNLDGCRSVTDASLVAIAFNCLKLSELDVSGCTITDSGIAALACAIQLNLQILSISRCRLVSDKSLPYFAKLGVGGLNLQNCDGISNPAVSHLVNRLWHCDILS